MLKDIVAEKVGFVSVESRAITNCGQCNKSLPLSFTDRRYKVEKSLMNLSFCSWKCVMDHLHKK